jgi:hypothetical protein
LNGAGAARSSSSMSGSASAARAGSSSEGRFAFPTLDTAGALSIDFVVEGCAYKLWPDDALLLRRNGILQGIAPDAKEGNSHYCRRCRHHWTAPAQANMRCPNCKAGDWAEYQLLRCSHCHAVFENHEIRDTIRGGIPSLRTFSSLPELPPLAVVRLRERTCRRLTRSRGPPPQALGDRIFRLSRGRGGRAVFRNKQHTALAI